VHRRASPLDVALARADARLEIGGRERAAVHDKTANMTIAPRFTSTSWPLLAVAVSALALTACKKQPDAQPPDDGGSPAGAEGGAAGNDDAASDDPAPDFLTVDAFEETITAKQGDVTDCFAAAKEKKADLGGKLALEFTIGGDGKVTEVKLEPGSTVNDPGLTTCVTDKARTWQFPKTRDGQPMTLPYSFNLS
jgi:hypothetical protein